MELAQLYSHGTKLAEVSPDFRGMSWKDWQVRNVTKWATPWLADHAGSDPLKNKKIAGPRDSYGWRSLPGANSPVLSK